MNTNKELEKKLPEITCRFKKRYLSRTVTRRSSKTALFYLDMILSMREVFKSIGEDEFRNFDGLQCLIMFLFFNKINLLYEFQNCHVFGRLKHCGGPKRYWRVFQLLCFCQMQDLQTNNSQCETVCFLRTNIQVCFILRGNYAKDYPKLNKATQAVPAVQWFKVGVLRLHANSVTEHSGTAHCLNKASVDIPCPLKLGPIAVLVHLFPQYLMMKCEKISGACLEVQIRDKQFSLKVQKQYWRSPVITISQL